MISVNAESQQAKPNDQTIEQKANQTKANEKISNHQNSDTAEALPLQKTTAPIDLKKTTSDKGNYSQHNPKKWGDVLNNPVDVFTGVIAFFTILLVAAGFYQAAVTRSTTRKQLRAYVFIDTIDITNIIPPPPSTELPPGSWVYQPDFGPLAFIVIKNTGQTPAYGVLH